MADIIVRVVYGGTTYDLDIDSNIPLRLDVSAVENESLGSFYGVGSQTFELPGTKKNNRFFKNGYEIGTDDIPAFYNSIEGYIIYNGETVLQGQLQLTEIITDESGYVSYKVQITDNVVQFKDALASKLVKDADWSSYNHTLTKEIIEQSWNDELLSGSVYYPMADYGRGDDDNYPDMPRIQASNDVGGIGNILTPMQLKQFLPAIKVKDVMDVLFTQVGYTYTGSFTETDDFNNLYLLNKPNSTLGIVTEDGTTATFQATSTINQAVPIGTTAKVSVTTEISDPQNKYDSTISEYNVDESGGYTFTGQIGFFNPVASDPASDISVLLEMVYKTDGSSAEAVLDSEEILLTYTSGFTTKYLNVSAAGDRSAGGNIFLRVTYTKYAGSGSPQNLTLTSFNTSFQCTEAPISYDGATVDMGLQWNPQLKSLDFIKGMISQFNLVFTPNYGENNSILIEHFDDWMRLGENKDWTDKFETAERISINHTVDEQQREVLLKSADDVDRFSVLAIENTPNFQYGTQRILADNNISQGEKKLGDYFAPVVLGGSLIPFQSGSDGSPTYNIDLNTSLVIPHLYKYDNNKQNSFAFKSRLGYKISNLLPSGSQVNVGTQGNLTSISGSYSTISNVSSLPVVSGSTYDLHYNNDYANFTGKGYNLNDGITAFDRYWKTYLDSLYWEGSRKLKMDIQFSSYEYKDIKLNDIIFIKNQQYRINKISGFNLSKDDVVSVELIKLYPAYYSSTTTPPNCDFNFIAINGGTPTTSTTSTSTSTTSTTTSTTTTGPTFQYKITATQGNGSLSAVGSCQQTLPAVFHSSRASLSQLQQNDIVYSDSNLTLPWNGGGLWYGMAEGFETISKLAWYIGNNGGLVNFDSCATTTTSTTTSTTTQGLYTYYEATQCGSSNITSIRSTTPLSIGTTIKLFGSTCYEITSVGGSFGFDYGGITYTDCADCQSS